MNCPDEFIQAQFIDRELPEREAAEFAMHLKFCIACRERVTALKAENQLISQSIQTIDPHDLGRELPGIRAIALFAAVFSGAAALVRMGIDMVAGAGAQVGLDGIFPFNGSELLNWLAKIVIDLVEKGGSMTSLTERAGIAILNLAILLALCALARKLKRFATIVSMAALLLVVAMPSYAVEIRKSQRWGGVSVAPGETINDTLIVIGDSININGTITGDLVAAGRQINIQGTVQGNAFLAAQRVQITGKVGGDVVGAGLDVFANGPIDGSLWGFGTRVAVGANGKVQMDAVVLGTELNADGEIGRDILAAGALLDIGSAIGRNVLYYGQQIIIRTPAKIGGKLLARVKADKFVKIDPTVVVAGGKQIEIKPPEPSRYLSFGFYMKQLLRIGGAFLMGLLFFWIFPRAGYASFLSSRSVLTAGGIGFLALVAAPIAAIIVAITIVGIPIGVALLALWLLGLYLAKIVVAAYIGRAIIGRKGSAISSTALALIIGLFMVVAAVNLPYIGSVLNFFLILIGLGSLVVFGYRMWESRRQTEGSVA
jgi:hypothetical protein